MTDEEVDAACEFGMPLCPWFGKPEYEAHNHRKIIVATRAFLAAAINTMEALALEGEPDDGR